MAFEQRTLGQPGSLLDFLDDEWKLIFH